jgi:hypothetical protein
MEEPGELRKVSVLSGVEAEGRGGWRAGRRGLHQAAREGRTDLLAGLEAPVDGLDRFRHQLTISIGRCHPLFRV